MMSDASVTMGQRGMHPTAVISEHARLGVGVQVGPYAVIEDDVVIGDRTVIGPHAVIHRDVELGCDNHLGAGVVVGGDPQHRQYGGERTYVRMGDRNLLGEYASVSRAFGAGETTVIGNDNFIMSFVRVAHNCRIGNNAILVSGLGLAGHVQIDDQAYIGGQAGLHQFVRVGRLAMVGGLSLVRQDIPPFVLAAGSPARAYSLNTVGLARAGVSPLQRTILKRAFAILYRSGLSVSQALARLETEYGSDPGVGELIEFIRRGVHKRGIVRWNQDKSSP